MPNRNYKFTNKHHPVQAICSTILGLVSLLGLAAAVYLSFLAEGGTKPGYGLTGLLAVLFSVAGLILGLLSFRRNDCFHVFCYVGSILNGMALLFVGILFSMGLN